MGNSCPVQNGKIFITVNIFFASFYYVKKLQFIIVTILNCYYFELLLKNIINVSDLRQSLWVALKSYKEITGSLDWAECRFFSLPPIINFLKNKHFIFSCLGATLNDKDDDSLPAETGQNHPFFRRSDSMTFLGCIPPNPFEVPLAEAIPLADQPHLLQVI